MTAQGGSRADSPLLPADKDPLARIEGDALASLSLIGGLVEGVKPHEAKAVLYLVRALADEALREME